MLEAPEGIFARIGWAYPVARSTVRPERPAADANLAVRGWIRPKLLGLSEERRGWNRNRSGSGCEVRCECARPDCTETLPAVAETNRRRANQFLVAPAHFDGVVVSAADRFFVVERRGDDVRRPAGEAS
jgi:hypothetical protein